MALPVILRDDFTSINLDKWELIEQISGTVIIEDGALRLLDNRTLNAGIYRLIEGIDTYPLEIEFTFRGWGTADGFTCIFYHDDGYSFGGGSKGFSGKGYGVMFDTYMNKRISLNKDHYSTFLAYKNYTWADQVWRHCLITIYPENGRDRVKVYIDDVEIISWLGTLDKTYDRFGFVSATGYSAMYAYIGYVEVRGGEWQPGFFAKVNGQWKQSNAYVKVGGSWRPVEAGWVKDNGVWKRLMG